jgi:protein gp37
MMGTTTSIEWTDHTFNLWRGCEKVHTGCKNCYAEKQAKRNPHILGEWGRDGTRIMAALEYKRQPLKWNQAIEGSHR